MAGTGNIFKAKRQTLMSFRTMRAKRTQRKEVGEYLRLVCDDGCFVEIESGLKSRDPLNFPGYGKKLEENRILTDEADSCVAGCGRIEGLGCVMAELSRNFMMGSMGTAAGEKLTMAFEEADRRELPLIIFSASGGARMQEGMFSLMQMAKTSAAAKRFSDHGGLYISVLTHPTTGGVSASYASLGDVILAEPGALIGFAGPRVIEQTIGEKLPAGFQRAEFQMEHGFVDGIVPKDEMKKKLGQLLRLHRNTKSARDIFRLIGKQGAETKQDGIFDTGDDKSRRLRKNGTEGNVVLRPFDRVTLARETKRPKITDFIEALFDDFVEMRGDRLGKEDPAILGGIASYHGIPVTVIGHRKGHDLKENLKYNFGMPEPEGYRKALRLMKQAEKFGRPVITFIDTPGAYPGKDAEENGQSVAIAENLAQMSSLRTPVVVVVTGEGNSGGALAIGVGDRILMLENAVYSVLSPEGFASILWKKADKISEACEVMKLTAQDLVGAGLADELIPEPEGGIQKDFYSWIRILDAAIAADLSELLKYDGEELASRRYEKFRRIEGAMNPAVRTAGCREGD